MKTVYRNQQDDDDPLNGAAVAGGENLVELLDLRRRRVPFIAELSADNGFQLTIGIGSDVSFAQYRKISGALPYLVAVPPHPRLKVRYVDFLINNTPTPIPGRYVLTFEEMKQIALHFLETGERSESFVWESI